MCKWYCTSEGANTNLRCLSCGCRYCSACLHGEAGKMTSMIKCARCGKKPTVLSNAQRGAWKAVSASAAPPSSAETAEAGLLGGMDAEQADLVFSSGLRSEGRPGRRAEGAPPTGGARPTAEAKGGVFSRLTDTSQYTGAHKHRFDPDGRGRAAEGRDVIVKGAGHVPPSAGSFRQGPAETRQHTPTEATRPAHPTAQNSVGSTTPAEAIRPAHPSAQSSVGSGTAPPAQAPGGPAEEVATPHECARERRVEDVSFRRLHQGAAAQPLEAAELDEVFAAFCGAGRSDMEQRTFVKLCKDSQLTNKRFTANDADLIFSKVKGKGQRRIALAQFEEALELIAQKRGSSLAAVRAAVLGAGGPQFAGTATDAVRFHDDTSTYTGVHARGGPDVVAKGVGSATQLAAAGMRLQ